MLLPHANGVVPLTVNAENPSEDPVDPTTLTMYGPGTTCGRIVIVTGSDVSVRPLPIVATTPGLAPPNHTSVTLPKFLPVITAFIVCPKTKDPTDGEIPVM